MVKNKVNKKEVNISKQGLNAKELQLLIGLLKIANKEQLLIIYKSLLGKENVVWNNGQIKTITKKQ